MRCGLAEGGLDAIRGHAAKVADVEKAVVYRVPLRSRVAKSVVKTFSSDAAGNVRPVIVSDDQIIAVLSRLASGLLRQAQVRDPAGEFLVDAVPLFVLSSILPAEDASFTAYLDSVRDHLAAFVRLDLWPSMISRAAAACNGFKLDQYDVSIRYVAAKDAPESGTQDAHLMPIIELFVRPCEASGVPVGTPGSTTSCKWTMQLVDILLHGATLVRASSLSRVLAPPQRGGCPPLDDGVLRAHSPRFLWANVDVALSRLLRRMDRARASQACTRTTLAQLSIVARDATARVCCAWALFEAPDAACGGALLAHGLPWLPAAERTALVARALPRAALAPGRARIASAVATELVRTPHAVDALLLARTLLGPAPAAEAAGPPPAAEISVVAAALWAADAPCECDAALAGHLGALAARHARDLAGADAPVGDAAGAYVARACLGLAAAVARARGGGAGALVIAPGGLALPAGLAAPAGRDTAACAERLLLVEAGSAAGVRDAGNGARAAALQRMRSLLGHRGCAAWAILHGACAPRFAAELAAGVADSADVAAALRAAVALQRPAAGIALPRVRLPIDLARRCGLVGEGGGGDGSSPVAEAVALLALANAAAAAPDEAVEAARVCSGVVAALTACAQEAFGAGPGRAAAALRAAVATVTVAGVLAALDTASARFRGVDAIDEVTRLFQRLEAVLGAAWRQVPPGPRSERLAEAAASLRGRVAGRTEPWVSSLACVLAEVAAAGAERPPRTPLP